MPKIGDAASLEPSQLTVSSCGGTNAMSVEQWMRYGQARACDPNLIEGCKMQDMKKQEPRKRLDVTDVLWVVILTMQTTFLGAAVYQSAWPEGLEWVGMLLFLGSAAVLCSAIRWAWRKKSAAEVAAQELTHGRWRTDPQETEPALPALWRHRPVSVHRQIR